MTTSAITSEGVMFATTGGYRGSPGSRGDPTDRGGLASRPGSGCSGRQCAQAALESGCSGREGAEAAPVEAAPIEHEGVALPRPQVEHPPDHQQVVPGV